MTAVTSSPATASPLSHRIANVLRLHIANPWQSLITPWLVYAAIFAANMAIWLAVTTAAGGRDQLDSNAFSTNGGASWIFVYMMVISVQAMNLSFAFALGLGMTRRDYYLGTAAFFVALSAMYAAGITVLAGVETATGGWGVDGRFFSAWVVAELPSWQQFLVYFLLALLFFSFGATAGSVWVRWRTLGIYVFLGAILLLVVAWVWGTTAAGGWGTVGRFFTDNSTLTVVLWTLPVTLVSGVAGYLVLRRATPK